MVFLRKKITLVMMVLICHPSPLCLGSVILAKLGPTLHYLYVPWWSMLCAVTSTSFCSCVSCVPLKEAYLNKPSTEGMYIIPHLTLFPGQLKVLCLPARWVHVVCMLYTPNVEYMEPGLLSGVTLDQLPASRWGSKSCQLCEDLRMSRTGICIGCDAGLCKSSFHVTWYV